MAASDTAQFSAGTEYTETGLVAWGVVARQLATHEVKPLPGRPMSTCRLDRLGGNTMCAMHLAEIPPGGSKCNHRHLDETMAYMLTGHGFTELRQSDYKAPLRVDWEAGDMVVIPTNAWHRHVNLSTDEPARQVSFRNTPLMNRLLHGDGGGFTVKDRVYNRPGRFENRFDDEQDYFSVREDLGPRRVRTNFIKHVAGEELPAPDPSLGEGVSIRYYALGGQLTMNVALMGLAGGGHTLRHSPLAEESWLVLRGSGRTDIWRDDERHALHWKAGDVICPPLGVPRQHHADPEQGTLVLRVRNVALERALGLEADEPALESPQPSRFPELVASP